MVAVHSTMLELGTPAPSFTLPDAWGAPWSLDDQPQAPALVVIFLCNHCPYVTHIAPVLASVTTRLQEAGVLVVGINSNDAGAYPDDAPDGMRSEIERWGYTFAYLVDADQSVAHAYRAACTPDLFVFDADRRLAYRGQFDDARPRNDEPVTGADLTRAVDAVLAGRPVEGPQHPSMGCNIKWLPGNEPAWFG